MGLVISKIWTTQISEKLKAELSLNKNFLRWPHNQHQCPCLLGTWCMCESQSSGQGGQGGMLLLITDVWLWSLIAKWRIHHEMACKPWKQWITEYLQKPHKYVLSITSMCTLSVYAHDAILVSTSLKNCDDQFQYLMHETPKIISKEAFYYIMDQNKNKKMKTETEKPLCASKRYKNAKNFFFTMKLIILWMNTRSLNGMGHSTFNPKQEQTINKVHVHPRTT